EVFVSASELTLQWDTVSFVQKLSYSVTATYKSFDSIQGNQTWTDTRAFTGTWTFANNTLSLQFAPGGGGFSISNPTVNGQTLTTILTNPGLLGAAAASAALQLSR
ncbi:MAG TPA: hypothetical protein VM100_11850, partial [Longimicrobiales bacterium]|nr:hypothetical protein [Longimicrobiales bacterium]